MSELKMCPFCGKPPRLGHFPYSTERQIKCLNKACPVRPYVSGEGIAQARRNWNTRAADPRIASEHAALLERVERVRDTLAGWEERRDAGDLPGYKNGLRRALAILDGEPVAADESAATPVAPEPPPGEPQPECDGSGWIPKAVPVPLIVGKRRCPGCPACRPKEEESAK